MRLMLTISAIIGLGLASNACGADNETRPQTVASTPAPTLAAASQTNSSTTPAAAPAPTAAKKADNTEIIYCPEIDRIIKKELFWGSSGGWRSYAQSFVKELETFVGAQWVGIKVGKMLCIYRGSEGMTFPVILQNSKLTAMPKREKLPKSEKYNQWGSYTNGYVNCNSVSVYDCPFIGRTKNVDIEEAFEELDFFKDKENGNNGN